MFSDSKMNILHRLVLTDLGFLISCTCTFGSDTSEMKADRMLSQVSLALSNVVVTDSLNPYTSENIKIICLILNIIYIYIQGVSKKGYSF